MQDKDETKIVREKREKKRPKNGKKLREREKKKEKQIEINRYQFQKLMSL